MPFIQLTVSLVTACKAFSTESELTWRVSEKTVLPVSWGEDRGARSPAEDLFHDPPWMPEATDSTGPDMDCFFLNTYRWSSFICKLSTIRDECQKLIIKLTDENDLQS